MNYRVTRCPPIRKIIIDTLEAQKPFTSYGMFDVDVTETLSKLRSCQRTLRIGISFHAYILSCFARALADNPYMQSYLFGDRLVTYEGVDISTIIEKRLPDNIRVPVAYIVRNADGKTAAQINWEMRQAMSTSLADDANVTKRRALANRPKWLRRWFWWRVARSPELFRQYRGTAGLTNMQGKGIDHPSYAMPPNLNTCTISIGSIYSRVMLDQDNQPHTRQSLCIGVAMDHAVVDGAPTVQFLRSLSKYIESADGLDESFVEETRQLRNAAQTPSRETT